MRRHAQEQALEKAGTAGIVMVNAWLMFDF
jgi:hypothetical protein